MRNFSSEVIIGGSISLLGLGLLLLLSCEIASSSLIILFNVLTGFQGLLDVHDFVCLTFLSRPRERF